MTSAGLTEIDTRERLYDRLMRRNKIVGLLRIAVPLMGVVLFGYLAAQIIVANLARDFGADGIRIERETVIIDKPTYAGVMTNGTRYQVVADSAEKQIVGEDVLDLSNVRLQLLRQDGYELIATAEHALYDLTASTVAIPGLMVVDDSNQTHALLRDNNIDWTTQTLVSRGDVDVHYPDGTRIEAIGLNYDGASNEWVFGPTVLTSGGDEQ